MAKQESGGPKPRNTTSDQTALISTSKLRALIHRKENLKSLGLDNNPLPFTTGSLGVPKAKGDRKTRLVDGLQRLRLMMRGRAFLNLLNTRKSHKHPWAKVPNAIFEFQCVDLLSRKYHHVDTLFATKIIARHFSSSL